MLFLIPLGFATKFYQGPGMAWIGDYGGAVLYEIFWCCVAALIWPRGSALMIALWVFGITCLLECMQLWHAPFLEAIRSNFLGRTLIGIAFKWSDFPYYVLGSASGWGMLRLIQWMHARKEGSK